VQYETSVREQSVKEENKNYEGTRGAMKQECNEEQECKEETRMQCKE
jgi:hypothetical protein